MDIKNLFQSPKFKKILHGIGTLVVVLLIFQVGMFVGFHRAGYAYHFGDNYYRAFNNHNRMMPREMMQGEEFPNAHGSVGKIISISLPTFVVDDPRQTEKIIRVSDSTSVRRSHDTLKLTDLHIGDFVVIIGAPNERAEIDAKLIRLLPPPPEFINTGAGSSTGVTQ